MSGDQLTIDAGDVRALQLRTFEEGWYNDPKTPEWAKDLTPEHVRDVCDWVISREVQVPL